MALYSVWDWNRNAYRIYSTRQPVSVGDDPVPPRPTGLSAIGADPDTHIKPLPAGARLVGHSHLARGEVRRLSGGLGDGGDDGGVASGAGGTKWVMLVAGIALGAGAMHLFMGRER